MEDLWPDDLMEVARVRTPLSILKEQASILTAKTGNLIDGEVLQITKASDSFSYVFHIVARAPGNYRFRVFRIYHEIMLYPVFLTVDTDILGELESVKGAEQIGENEFQLDSQDFFQDVLKKIFGSDKVRKVIGALVSQIEA